MEWQHPVFLEMLQMGCSNPLKVMSTFQTYMKLCEVDRVHDIDFFYNKELDCVYLKTVSGQKTIVHFTVPMQLDLSPALLHKVSTELLKQHEGAELDIVLKTPDTGLLSYSVTQGLSPPPTPETTKLKKAHQEQVQFVQNELHKRKAELYEEAKRKKRETGHIKEEEEPQEQSSDCVDMIQTGVELRKGSVDRENDCVEITNDCVEPGNDCVELKKDCVELENDCVELKKDHVELKGDCVEPSTTCEDSENCESAKELKSEDSDSTDFKDEL